MSDVVLLGYNPRLDSIIDQIVESNSVAHVDRLLNSQHSQYFKLDVDEVGEEQIKLLVLEVGL